MITFTESAYNKIISNLKKRGAGTGIRIGIKTTGCSGLAYVLEYVDEYQYEEGIVNFAQKEFVVIVNQKHLPYIQNTIVDYVRSGLNEGFEFKNPNERDRCGCGESFRI